MSVGEFKAAFARGGGPWTMAVNQTLGAVIARAAVQMSITPNQLTLASLVLGVGTAAAVLLLHDSYRIMAGVLGLAGWQLAYSCDCADGQVARATKSFAKFGAALDLVVDFLVHVATSYAVVAVATSDWEQNAVPYATFVVSAWVMPIYYEAVTGAIVGAGGGSVSVARKLFRVARDYGVHVAILPAALLVGDGALAVAAAVIASLHYMQFIGRTLSFAREG